MLHAKTVETLHITAQINISEDEKHRFNHLSFISVLCCKQATSDHYIVIINAVHKQLDLKINPKANYILAF